MAKEINTPQVEKIDLNLKKLARASAWLLLAGIIVLIVSGWGITQTGVIYNLTGGLIDRRLADAIHRAANVPLAFFFLSHVLINISLMVSRKNQFRVRLTNVILIVVGAAFMAIMIYMQYFRRGG
jgi:cytochrome b subunit of formate dehydrogenase